MGVRAISVGAYPLLEPLIYSSKPQKSCKGSMPVRP